MMNEHEKDAVLLAFQLAKETGKPQALQIGEQEYVISPVKPHEPWD